MTAHATPLDGADWTMREALGDTWQWYVDAPFPEWRNNVADAARDAQRAPGWWPASVPGSVVTDLWRAGELPDPYRARNTRASEWTAARSWVYRRAVELPELAGGERAVLEFDGLDPSGTVFWDGRPLGRIEGLYHRARFAIPEDAAQPGRHRLAVVLDPVPASQPQVGRTELVRVHGPRMNEGWDFCPRFPHQGIWRAVRLVVGTVHVADVVVRSELDDAGNGIVSLTAAVETTNEQAFRMVLLDPSGRSIAECANVARDELHLRLGVERPALWWPHSHGEQNLCSVRLCTAEELLWQCSIGFRRASLVPNDGAPDDALPYTALVNGTVVPLVGWNWVPADAQYGAASPHRVRHLVELAARSGAQLLRVWGGGLVETDDFYAACDRAGLFVWQEFSQSSSGVQSAPATDAEFVAMMRREAAAVVPPRVHHPSLLAWGGGNELDADGTPLDERRSPVLAALRECVGRLDPGRAWLPTSPTGPVFHYRDGGHDVHGPWEHQGLRDHHALYNAGRSLAHTEFGVEGMTNRRALLDLIPEPDRWPADKTNPVYRHLGEWWINAPLVQDSFGGRLDELEPLRKASQLLQATGLGYAVEADRRRFPHCSMVLPWQLNESYPNAWCTSAVDHAGMPKPAYFAVARAFAPRRVTARVATSAWADATELRAEAWVWDEHGTAPGSRVVARLRGADGSICETAEWPVEQAVRYPRAVGTLTVPAYEVDAAFVWELTWLDAAGEVLDREAVLACTGKDFAPLLDLPRAALDVRAEAGAVRVTHRAGPIVVGLQVVPDTVAFVGGDPRPLLPGETRAFAVDSGAHVLVESWNTDPVHIEVPAKETR
ncbi:MAG TPA: hypothetical protein VE442_20620 [Jatrophihabitans sp.]|jgi:beta-mannosidase|nr:hypothetical protein [Jatrophihabitans sp.]